MGGYISTYLNTTPIQTVKDASGSTVPTTDTTSNDVLPLPPARDPPQTTVESVPETVIPALPSTEQPVELIEKSDKSIEKTIEVDALPSLYKTQINGGKNKKKGRKH